MKVVVLKHDVEIGRQDLGVKVELKANKRYILPEYMYAKFSEHPIIKSSRELYQAFRQYRGASLTNQTVVFLREGGLGDILFLTAFCTELKTRYPNCKVVLGCNGKYQRYFDDNGPFDAVLPYPVDFQDLDIYCAGKRATAENCYFFSMEGLIEEDADAKTTNIYSLIGEKLGTHVTKQAARPVVRQPKESEELRRLVSGHLVIALQTSASSPIRSFKPAFLIDFLNLWNLPCKMILLDSPYKTDWLRNKVLANVQNDYVDFIMLDDVFEDTTLEDSLSALVLSDMLIAPDSSMPHFAAAWNIPTVALFGAFHTDLRLSTYPNVLGVNVQSNCKYAVGELKSCCEHGHSCSYAQELNRVFAPCMDLLQPEHVVALSYYFLKKKQLGNAHALDIALQTQINPKVKEFYDALWT